jgi:hypothetical protein
MTGEQNEYHVIDYGRDPAEPDVGSRVEIDDKHRQQRRSAAHLSASAGISRSVGPRFIFR